MVPGIGFGVDSTRIRPSALFTTANFAGASTAQLDRRARRCYALLTGRVTSISGTAVRSTRPRVSLRLSRQAPAGGPAERVLALRAGLVARDADAHAERRPAVGRARCRSCRSNDIISHVAPTPTPCGVSGIGPNGRVPLLPAGRDAAASRRRSCSSTASNLGLEHRLEQRRAEHRRRVAAERAGRLAADAARAIPSRRRCAPATRWPTTAKAWRIYTGQYGANPGSSLSVTRNARHGNLVAAGETLPGLLQPDSRTGSDAPA